MHHVKEIVAVERFLIKPNKKVQSVLLDLKDSRLICMVQSLAITYCRITEPYWRLLESNCIAYTELPQVIFPLLCKVKALHLQPGMIFDETIHFIDCLPSDTKHPLYASSMTICHIDRKPLLLQCISTVAKGIQDTMTTQLGNSTMNIIFDDTVMQ